VISELAGAVLKHPAITVHTCAQVESFDGYIGRMAAGAVLEIRLQDRDTFQDLLMIFDRSADQLLAWEQRDDDYYLWVRKSPG